MEDLKSKQRREFLNTVKDRKADREKYMTSLRKQVKQEIFRKKRVMNKELRNLEEEAQQKKIFEETCKATNPKILDPTTTPEEALGMITETLKEPGKDAVIYEGLIKVLNELLIEHSATIIPEVIRVGTMEALSPFYEYVFEIPENHRKESIIFHFCGIISNAFTTDDESYLEYLISNDLKILEFLNKCLNEYSNDDWMLCDILFPLNNILGSPSIREYVHQTDYLEILKKYCLNDPYNCSANILQKLSWGLANYCDCKFEEDSKELHWIIEAISYLLPINEQYVKAHACLAISRLCDENEIGELAIKYNLGSFVLDIAFKSESFETKRCALKALGGISSSEITSVSNYLITLNIFDILMQILKENTGEIRTKTLWVVGNISGDKNICNQEIFISIIELLEKDKSIDTMKEIMYVLSNTIHQISLSRPFVETEIKKYSSRDIPFSENYDDYLSMGDKEIIAAKNNERLTFFIENTNIIQIMIGYLHTNPSDDVLSIMLDAFANIFRIAECVRNSGENENFDRILRENFTYIGGCECIEALITNPNADIASKATSILTEYLSDAFSSENGGFDSMFKEEIKTDDLTF
ncbi:unnamed protein product [Moneuplotes crassus]|uniref:Importin subunit alpha n=1 Tax=Euplotes crassus TaxID=5936 RepID=A0AAD1X8I5_EUPCR|nr:unnamed protein product [Moneuplotes crassus]